MALLLLPATASAADPGRWIETGFTHVPFEYFQGITSDPAGNHWFDGFTTGVYRTTPNLVEQAREEYAIPAEVAQREGYNHIGDLSWDAAEGGRLLLPLECFYPFQGNTCGTGSFGVADPVTLAWRYYVKLDPQDIKKAMWAETSPDGSLIWTSAGKDLLAYSSSDVVAANAAPGGPLIRPVRRLVDAVPPSGITGAAFQGGRLVLAGQDTKPFQVWSVDTDSGERRLEIERDIQGESEGLDFFDGFGGELHWQIGPISQFPIPPTYGYFLTAIVHFVPANSPPDCSGVTVSPSLLWPPNHKLRAVTLSGATDPDGDSVAVTVGAVTSEDSPGGAARPGTADWAPAGRPDQVLLRAERRGAGGRTYRIAFSASDGSDSCSGVATVRVPHSARDV